MNNIYFTVGPSQAYPTVDAHVRQAIKEEIFSLNHRGQVFTELYQSVEDQLKKLLSIPSEHSIFFSLLELKEWNGLFKTQLRKILITS